MSPKPAIPARTRLLVSLVPALALMVVISTVLIFQWRTKYARLAREKKGAVLALPHLERARELIERAQKYARFPNPDLEDIRGMAEEAVSMANAALDRNPDSEEGHRVRGRALELMYDFVEAGKDYREARALHPHSPATLHLGLLAARELARARLLDMKAVEGDPAELPGRVIEPLNAYVSVPPEFKFEIDAKHQLIARTCVGFALGEYDRAINQAVAGQPLDTTEWLLPYLRGLSRLELKQFDAAISDLEQAIRASPGTADPHAWLAALYARKGRRTDARTLLGFALQADPRFLEAYLLRSAMWVEDGRHEEAMADFAAAEKLRPALPETPFRRGEAALERWRREGRSKPALLEEAEACFTKFLERSTAPAGYVRRGEVRLERGNREGAEADFTIAVSKGDPEAFDRRAGAHEAAGRWEPARADWTQAIERSADPARRTGALRRRARIPPLEARLADYDALLAHDAKDVSLHLEKAGALAEAGRLDDALAATAMSPPAATIHAFRADIFLKKEDAAATEREASAALALDPLNAAALVARGHARLKSGDKVGAAADWKRALGLRPDLKPSIEPLIERTHP